MLPACSPCPRRRLLPSVPSTSSVVSYPPRSNRAGASRASPAPPRQGNAPALSQAGSRCRCARFGRCASGDGYRISLASGAPTGWEFRPPEQPKAALPRLPPSKKARPAGSSVDVRRRYLSVTTPRFPGAGIILAASRVMRMMPLRGLITKALQNRGTGMSASNSRYLTCYAGDDSPPAASRRGSQA